MEHPSHIHWRTITPSNTTSIYGRDKGSRDQNSSNGRIFSWLLSETYDISGNAIVYEYKQEDSVGVPLNRSHEKDRRYSSNISISNASNMATGRQIELLPRGSRRLH